jgi:hypothetical protein
LSSKNHDSIHVGNVEERGLNNDSLKIVYREILKEIDPCYLGRREDRPGGLHGLSGLFLPSVSAGYSQAAKKVMVVGAETRAWEPLDGGDLQSMDGYVDRAMEKHAIFFAQMMGGANDRGRSFHNFTRAVKQRTGAEGLIYSNLFCFAWGKKKGSPIKSGKEVFPVIKELSRKILDAQIKTLQPDCIVFANGIASAPYRREFFPHGESGRCTSPDHAQSAANAIDRRYFWEFVLDKKIRCFRIQHPSARSSEAERGRAFALDLLSLAPTEVESSRQRA